MADNKTKSQKLVDKAKSNPYQKYKSLVFPNELGSRTDGHTHYILFNINSQNYKSSGTSDAKDLGGKGGIVTQSPTGRNLNYNQTNKGLIKSPIPRTQLSIALQMPDNTINAKYGADWAGVDTGVVGGAKVVGTAAVAAAGKAAETSQGRIDTFKKDLSSNVYSDQVKTAGIEALTPEQVTQVFELAPKRQASNPRTEVLFSKVSNRGFNFKFTLNAKSSDEADTIQAIIESLKFAMMPALLGGQNGYYSYPDEFDISFWRVKEDGSVVENEYVHKISTCALTSLDIDYGGVGRYAVYYDGKPISVVIEMAFTELEVLNKNRILEGY